MLTFPGIFCAHECVSPISRALWVSVEVERKVSPLHERVTTPTSPEVLAKMRAFSSDKLTPAIEATSLISSSSTSSLDKTKFLRRKCSLNKNNKFYPFTVPGCMCILHCFILCVNNLKRITLSKTSLR